MPRVFRSVVVALVILCASPATAPFSTCDLIDLFSDTDIAPAAAVVNAAPSKDLSSLPAADAASAAPVPHLDVRTEPVRSADGHTPPRSLPLRL